MMLPVFLLLTVAAVTATPTVPPTATAIPSPTPTAPPMAVMFSTYAPTPTLPPAPNSLADLAARTKLKRERGGAIVISDAGLQTSFPTERPATRAEYAELIAPFARAVEAERLRTADLIGEGGKEITAGNEAEWSKRLALHVAKIRTTAANLDAIVPPPGLERLHSSIRAFVGAIIDVCAQAQNAASLKTRDAFAEAKRSTDRLSDRLDELKAEIASLGSPQ